jgi:tetratricopeptide (TPR) repeat protein
MTPIRNLIANFAVFSAATSGRTIARQHGILNVTCVKVLFLIVLNFIAWASIEDARASESVSDILAQAVKAEANAEYPRAKQLYARALEAFPENAEVWAAWGEHLRFYAHEFPASKAAFERALKMAGASANSQAFAQRGLGEIAMKNGDAQSAIKYFEESLKALPLADTHRSLCHLYGTMQNFDRAALHARRAVELQPDDPISVLLLAAQLARAGDRAQGEIEFDKALTFAGLRRDGTAGHPVHCCVLYNAAGFLAVSGDHEAALNMLRAFFETPNHRHLTRQEIENDPDFAPLKAGLEFPTLLDEYLKTK